MRKRIALIVVMACIAPVLRAQISSAIEFSLGGGWSTLGYKAQVPSQPDVYGSNNGSWGLQAHVGYALFFARYFGLGVGAEVSHIGSIATYGGTARWDDTDSEGQNYSHLVAIHSLTDKKDVWYLEVPLTFYVLVPLSVDVSLNLEAGAKYSLPIRSSASYKTSFEHMGEYSPFGLLLYDIPEHGFYDVTDLSDSYTIMASYNVSAFLKAGIEYKLSTKTRVFANAYADFGCVNSLQDISSKPIQAGLEVGIRFVFTHRNAYPCHCVDN